MNEHLEYSLLQATAAGEIQSSTPTAHESYPIIKGERRSVETELAVETLYQLGFIARTWDRVEVDMWAVVLTEMGKDRLYCFELSLWGKPERVVRYNNSPINIACLEDA